MEVNKGQQGRPRVTRLPVGPPRRHGGQDANKCQQGEPTRRGGLFLDPPTLRTGPRSPCSGKLRFGGQSHQLPGAGLTLDSTCLVPVPLGSPMFTPGASHNDLGHQAEMDMRAPDTIRI